MYLLRPKLDDSSTYKILIGGVICIGISAFVLHKYKSYKKGDTSVTPIQVPSPEEHSHTIVKRTTPTTQSPQMQNKKAWIFNPPYQEYQNADDSNPEEHNINKMTDIGITDGSIQEGNNIFEIKVASTNDMSREAHVQEILRTLEELGFVCEPLFGGWILARGNQKLVETLESTNKITNTLRVVRCRIVDNI